MAIGSAVSGGDVHAVRATSTTNTMIADSKVKRKRYLRNIGIVLSALLRNDIVKLFKRDSPSNQTAVDKVRRCALHTIHPRVLDVAFYVGPRSIVSQAGSD